MRRILGVLILGLLVSVARGERIEMQLEWGLSPAGSEIYWDGQVRVTDGRLVAMKAVSFEGDRHDRMTPPRFQSFTVAGGTDGMELVVEGDDQTIVDLESRQGDFQWKIDKLRQARELSFPSKEKGQLIVRILERLGDTPERLSDDKTQDSHPVVCPLSDGRQLILWRAFLSLPPEPSAAGGDQIRGRVLDRSGKPGKAFDVLPEAGDVELIAAAPDGEGTCRIVWSEQRQGNWDLFSCTAAVSADGAECSAPLQLTEDPGADKTPAVAPASDGSLVLAWQGWRGTESSVYFQRFSDGRWEEPIRLSDEGANDWNPTVATATDGSVAVAWSRWRGGSYDVCLRVWSAGGWGPVRLVAATEPFEAHPSLLYDRQGTLWIAYEEGRAGWGMDSYTAGLRSMRNLRLCRYRSRRVEVLEGSAALALPETLQDRSEMAHLATDGNGVIWLFFRSLSGRGVWNIHGTSLGDDGWIPPQKLPQTPGGQDVRMAAARTAEGRLRVVWASDHRVNQAGQENDVYTSLMPARDRRAQAVEVETAAAAEPASSDSAPAPGQRAAWDFGGARLGLYFGDLHRHTEMSVCRTGTDGSLEDVYRYAIDAAGLDFLCVTDHVQHVKILDDYDFWRSAKTADLNRVADLHQPFYGYERSQRFPFGHRNIIGLSRNVKRVPRTADNRPWSANSGYEGEKRVPPPELWKRLVGQNAITIPHTSTSPVMGTDFGHVPDAIEPVVEIYQGCRYTTEHAGAPDPRQTRDSDPYGGKAQAAGYIWNALSKGHRYGFIASSDHLATHNSYTCVWAEDFSTKAIHAALAKRQCYAATDAIQCRMHMGPHPMGSEFTAEEVPPLEVDVVGTTDIERVDVIRDNRIVFVREPKEPTRRVSFRFEDVRVEPGVHYYYARVIQTDRNIAWISPIWVTVGEKTR